MDDEGIICNPMLKATIKNRRHIFNGKVLRLNQMIEHVLVANKLMSGRGCRIGPLLNKGKLCLKADDT